MGVIFTAGTVDGAPIDASTCGIILTGDGDDGESIVWSTFLTFALLWALKRDCGCGRLEVLMGLGLFEVIECVEFVVVVTDSCKRGRLSWVPSCPFSLSCSCTRLLGPMPLLLIDGTAPSNICVSTSDKTRKKRSNLSVSLNLWSQLTNQDIE